MPEKQRWPGVGSASHGKRLWLAFWALAVSICSCFYRVASAITGLASSQKSLSSVPHCLLASLFWEGQFNLFLWQTTIFEFCMRSTASPLWTWFIISDTFVKSTVKTNNSTPPKKPYCYPIMSLMLWRSLGTPVCVLNCLSYLLWIEKGLLLFECDRSVRTVATTIYNYWFQCDIKGPKFNHYSLQLSQTKVNNSWVWTEGIKERLPTKISVLFLSETEVKTGNLFSVLLIGFEHFKNMYLSLQVTYIIQKMKM